MNNLFSYCGLVEVKINASDKDLPVDAKKNYTLQFKDYNSSVLFFYLKPIRPKFCEFGLLLLNRALYRKWLQQLFPRDKISAFTKGEKYRDPCPLIFHAYYLACR